MSAATLTAEQSKALREYAAWAGDDWKATLGDVWDQYEKTLPALAASDIDQVSLEFAGSGRGSPSRSASSSVSSRLSAIHRKSLRLALDRVFAKHPSTRFTSSNGRADRVPTTALWPDHGYRSRAASEQTRPAFSGFMCT